MNKYLSNKLDDLIELHERDLDHAYGGQVNEILESLVDSVVEMTSINEVFPLPKFIATWCEKKLAEFMNDRESNHETFVEELFELSEGLRKMPDEEKAHEMFLESIGPLMVKEDDALRRTEFSCFVDSLVRNEVVHNDVAKEWGQPIEFIQQSNHGTQTH